MLDSVLYEIGVQKWMFVIDFAIIILLSTLLIIFTGKFSWNRKKVKLFAFLYNLNRKQAACIGLLVGRLCFIITSVFYTENINLGYWLVLILFSVAIFILTLNLKSFLSGIFSFSVIFLLIYLKMSLYNFYVTMNDSPVFIVITYLIGLFILLYSVYQTLSSYEGILAGRDIKKREKING